MFRKCICNYEYSTKPRIFLQNTNHIKINQPLQVSLTQQRVFNQRRPLSVTDALRELQADADSTWEDVRKQYTKMVKQYHPDINRSHDAVDKFYRVQEAFQVLELEYRASEDFVKNFDRPTSGYPTKPSNSRKIVQLEMEEEEEEDLQESSEHEDLNITYGNTNIYRSIDKVEKKKFLMWGLISGVYVIGFMGLGYWVPWLLDL